jgi:hypothetical protein
MSRLLTVSLCSAGMWSLAMRDVAEASSYRCRNNEVEIGCSGGKCVPSSSFTPMDIHLLGRSGRLSVCAYSGCWTGSAKVVRGTNGYVMAFGSRLRANSSTLGPESAALMLDVSSNFGTIMFLGYINPVSCEISK